MKEEVKYRQDIGDIVHFGKLLHERGYFAATDGKLSVRLDCQSILINLFVGTHVTVEKLSAVTLKVASMPTSVRFYRDLLGLEILYGGEDAYFSSLRTKHGKGPDSQSRMG